MKQRLRKLNQEHFQHISQKAKRAADDLEVVQHQILAGGTVPDNYGLLRATANRLAEAERSFYQQKPKCAYLRQSDRCNKFFHDLVKRNNKRNTLVTITRASGEQTTSLREIADEFCIAFRAAIRHESGLPTTGQQHHSRFCAQRVAAAKPHCPGDFGGDTDNTL